MIRYAAPRRLSAFCLGVLLAGTLGPGCGDDAAPSYPGPAQALLGGGIFEFVHEPACSRVPIIHGPQGGYHIWTSVRARYLDFSGARVNLTYTDADSGALFHQVPELITDLFAVPEGRLTVLAGSLGDGARCADGGVPLDPSPSGGDGGVPSSAVPGGIDGWGEALALTALLPIEWTGCKINACVAERRLRLRVTVTDRHGRTATDERTLVPVQEAGEVSVYCTGDADLGIVAVDLGGERCL